MERVLTISKKNPRKKARKAAVRTAQYTSLSVLVFIVLLPVMILALKAFMTRDESIDVPIVIFPSRVSFDGLIAAFDGGFLNELKNTLIVARVNCIAIPLSASLCAYGFTRCKFIGRDIWFAVTLATIMLPGIVVQIPVFVMFVSFGWLNTFYPLIVPSFLGGGAVNIFLIRQFIKGVPKEIREAAKIDGANEFYIYLIMTMPLCLPVLLLITVNTFIGCWNDFMGPLLYLRQAKVYTLGIGIYHRFPPATNQQITYPNEQMAACLLMLIPPAVLFFIFQRQLIEGVALNVVKG